ncbi:MAG: hypothetical protein ACFB9N_18795 [Geitlerinemataceae cyanobacterium]
MSSQIQPTPLQEVERAVAQLSTQDFSAFREWFAALEAERWDRQIEADVAAGRLDDLATRALQQLEDGECRDRVRDSSHAPPNPKSQKKSIA